MRFVFCVREGPDQVKDDQESEGRCLHSEMIVLPAGIVNLGCCNKFNQRRR